MTTMKTLRFGIEIETVDLPKSKAAAAIQSIVGGHVRALLGARSYRVDAADGRTWKIVNDGSLRGRYNAEVVSPILGYADIEMVQLIVRALREAGARTNDSCGIHIHVDAATLGAKGVRNLLHIVNKQQGLIEKVFGIAGTRRRDQYCKGVNDRVLTRFRAMKSGFSLDDLKEGWYGTRYASASRYHNSRYHGLNLNAVWYLGTVEYRYFNGTLHAGKVKAYLQFCLALSSKAKKSKRACSKRRNPSGSEKYAFRCFLLGLGLIGAEFKTARKHLLANLSGSAAWKDGRPQNR